MSVIICLFHLFNQGGYPINFFEKRDSLNVSVVGYYPFCSPSFCESGEISENKYLFIGSGGGVLIYDVNDSFLPRRISDTIRTLGRIYKLLLKDTLLFIADGFEGWKVYNVSSPGSPRKVGEYTFLDSLRGVFWSYDVDTILFLGAIKGYPPITERVIAIYNIADPSNPILIGSCQGVGALEKFVVKYPALYAAYGDRLKVFDVSNLKEPRVVWEERLPAHINDLSFRDTILAIGFAYCPTLIQIFNISEPFNPQLIGSFNQQSGSADALSMIGEYLYFLRGSDLFILNLSNPRNPIPICSLPGLSLSWLDICNSLLYALAPDGFYIMDISEPSLPRLISYYSIIASAGPYYSDLATNGRYIYMASNTMPLYRPGVKGFIKVIDCQNPTFPKERGTALLPYTTEMIFVQHPYAYITTSLSGLIIADIANPDSPRVVNRCLDGFLVKSVFVRDTFAYVCCRRDRSFKVLSIADPYNPYIVGELIFSIQPSDFQRMFIRGNYAYIPTNSSGGGIPNFITIVDISDPRNPQEVGWYEIGLNEYATSIFLPSDHLAVVTTVRDYEGWVRTVDVSDPRNPYTLGFTNLGESGERWDVYASSSYAYIAGASRGINVLDIRDPRNLRLAGYYKISDWLVATAIRFSNGYIFTNEAGLVLFRFDSTVVNTEEGIPSPFGEIKVFPIVTKRRVKASYRLLNDGEVKIEIYDLLGKRIKNFPSERKRRGEYEDFLPLYDLPPGIYFLSLRAGNRSRCQKIIFVE